MALSVKKSKSGLESNQLEMYLFLWLFVFLRCDHMNSLFRCWDNIKYFIFNQLISETHSLRVVIIFTKAHVHVVLARPRTNIRDPNSIRDSIRKSGYPEGQNPDPDSKMLDPSNLDPDILIFSPDIPIRKFY